MHIPIIPRHHAKYELALSKCKTLVAYTNNGMDKKDNANPLYPPLYESRGYKNTLQYHVKF